MDQPQMPDHIELKINTNNEARHTAVIADKKYNVTLTTPVLARFHAGYFRISLSLCGQALLWKILGDSSSVSSDSHALRRVLAALPSTAFLLLWCLALFSLLALSLLYLLRCIFHSNLVKSEFVHHVGVNYLFAPWISLLLLLQSSPFRINEEYYTILWWVFVAPVMVLDVKIYGQWVTKGKRVVSAGANPASQLSVIGNLVGARAAGPGEAAVCMFALGMVHYLVVFVTLYQRLPGNEYSLLPARLRPVFFLFIAAPGMASLAWHSISGEFDVSAKMLFFLSIFLFISLVCRPRLFKKSMKKFSVAWWAYSFPLTVLALASAEYAQEVKGCLAHVVMLLLSALSVLVSLALLLFSAFNTKMLFPDHKLTPFL